MNTQCLLFSCLVSLAGRCSARKIGGGIHRPAIPPYFIMHVRAGGISGTPGFTDGLSGAYLLIHLHQPLFEMGIYRFKVMVMAEDDEFPIALLKT